MESVKLDPRFFTASGLNDAFHGAGLNFNDYCEQTREMIARARPDLTPENQDTILSANTPFEWQPAISKTSSQKYPRGVLLIHGMTDSPFILKDIGKVLLDNGFLVQSILLPGHGTMPGDLLYATYEEWKKSVRYGFEMLKDKVEQVFILGFSLGGTLAINLALDEPSIAGLILIAPAMRLKKQLSSRLLKYIWTLCPRLKWVRKAPQEDYCKYESLTFDAGNQTLRAIDHTQKKLREKSLTMPILMIFSADDEVVSTQAMIKLFKQSHHLKNNMLIYGKGMKDIELLKGVEIRNSSFPQQKILDFSHVSLLSSPNNVHYGINGDYKDFLHYPNKIPPGMNNIFLGTPSKENLKHHVIQRLRYNPDFEGMVEKMLTFVKERDFI